MEGSDPWDVFPRPQDSVRTNLERHSRALNSYYVNPSVQHERKRRH
jgi:hypothetical protein